MLYIFFLIWKFLVYQRNQFLAAKWHWAISLSPVLPSSLCGHELNQEIICFAVYGLRFCQGFHRTGTKNVFYPNSGARSKLKRCLFFGKALRLVGEASALPPPPSEPPDRVEVRLQSSAVTWSNTISWSSPPMSLIQRLTENRTQPLCLF